MSAANLYDDAINGDDPARDQGDETKIGQIFVNKGLITESQLAQALEIQATTNAPLGEVLVAEGWIERLHLASALTRQWSERGAHHDRQSEVAEPQTDAEAEWVAERAQLIAERDDLRRELETVKAELADKGALPDPSEEGHYLFVRYANGYTLVEREGGLPQPGETINLSFGGAVRPFRVTRVGDAPVPSRLHCAFLEAHD